MIVRRALGGAVAGGLAAAVWAAQQPFDKRVFGCGFDDVELLGKLITRGSSWPLAGIALHVHNGALFGALYAQLRPLVPAPPQALGLTVGLAEHLASWPLVRVVDRHHPARSELVTLSGNRRAFGQAAWRHALFGALLGMLEQRFNRGRDDLRPVPASSNGQGDIELAASPARARAASGAAYEARPRT